MWHNKNAKSYQNVLCMYFCWLWWLPQPQWVLVRSIIFCLLLYSVVVNFNIILNICIQVIIRFWFRNFCLQHQLQETRKSLALQVNEFCYSVILMLYTYLKVQEPIFFRWCKYFQVDVWCWRKKSYGIFWKHRKAILNTSS